MKLAYTGSFDPFTNGHLHIVEKALGMSKDVSVHVIIADNPGKKHKFSAEDRMLMVLQALKGRGTAVRVSILPRDKFAVNWAKENGDDAMLRGIRTEQDFQDECGVYHANRLINDRMETVYVMPDINLSAVRSSSVMSLIGPYGWVFAADKLVPPVVMNQICKKYCLARCEITQNMPRFEDLVKVFSCYDKNYYHNWKHIAYFLMELSLSQPDLASEVGVLMHDIVDPSKPEELDKILRDNWVPYANKCLEFLAATRHGHLPENLSEIQKIVHDIDMSVLSWDPEEYDIYAKNVEREYVELHNVSPEDFNGGRIMFLTETLKRNVFLTSRYNEAKARYNIKRELNGRLNGSWNLR